MRSPRRPSSSPARAGSAASAGPTRSACRPASIAPSREPGHVLPIGEWLKRGYAPAYGRKLAADELKDEASLLLPEGTYGPAFLTPKNYYVIKDYNFSDLYVLFVGHLSDRILDGRPFEKPWSKNTQLRTEQVEAMQRTLDRARALQATRSTARPAC